MKNILLNLTIFALCTILFASIPSFTTAAEQRSGQAQGCICGLDQGRKTLKIVPWNEAKKSYDLKAAKLFNYSDDTIVTFREMIPGKNSVKIVAGKNNITMAELSSGKALTKDVKGLNGLQGQRATLSLNRVKGREIINSIDLEIKFGGEYLPASVGSSGLELIRTKCPCEE